MLEGIGKVDAELTALARRRRTLTARECLKGVPMANLMRIDVTIQTGDRAGAGTDGSVYLGIAGREFHCDSTANDFERGSSRTYTFGDGANVRNGNRNDPRTPQLTREAVDRFPVYISIRARSGE